MEDPWLSVDELAVCLGVGGDTVHDWMRDREMLKARIGRFWRFKNDAVDARVATGKAAIETTWDERRER